ncbi:fumarylacetoacetate hydrolase family protein [Streptomyces malaysiensis]|uniref:fumarylacetoacetate hydrolase family protein n=1 Tax=Streptomyces malaysiensis TaxID=92644 RepID=UPI003714DA82
MSLVDYADRVLPADCDVATLVARVHDPVLGPCVASIRGDDVVDITSSVPTVSALLETADPVELVRNAAGERRWGLPDLLRATLSGTSGPMLLAPVDLQVLKAAGVTFVGSMLERVIEERAQGDPARAEEIRGKLGATLGTAISTVRPGSAEAAEVKRALLQEGMWSQYLEVGLGPDPEIFTKAPVLSAVGTGAAIGVLERSEWNNPEPELVLVADSTGKPRGAMLGNDVNLRDFEGRSALLLTEAKDNNASCALGPFIRLFDEHYTIDDARQTEIALDVTGQDDGFSLHGKNSVNQISRTFEELLAHTRGRHHQYPDGFVLFTGTLFAPTEDRDAPGQGFTHHAGDVVSISAERLGTLVNVVTSAEEAPPWTTGITDLVKSLVRRGALGQVQS